MDASEEPFFVTIDEPNLIIITCKKPEERDETVTRLKKTIIFRKIYRHQTNPAVAIIPCNDQKKRDRLLATILTTMRFVRVITGVKKDV